MSNVRPDIAAKLRRSAFVPVVIGGIVILAFWIVYFLAAVMNVDLLHHNQPPDRTALAIYPIVCLAATILAVPVVFLGMRESFYLSRHGIQTSAIVAHVGMVSKNGIRPVTYAYEVQGKEFKVKRDTAQICIDRFNESTRITVVYDPKRPSRCHVLSSEVLAST
ncbi:MAG TPA: hypothetical protein VFC78_15840 [Tepidisphaeraceae bacterium]|nr:hypothetical protein [Tepidisphaeraceae bacterium]